MACSQHCKVTLKISKTSSCVTTKSSMSYNKREGTTSKHPRRRTREFKSCTVLQVMSVEALCTQQVFLKCVQYIFLLKKWEWCERILIPILRKKNRDPHFSKNRAALQQLSEVRQSPRLWVVPGAPCWRSLLRSSEEALEWVFWGRGGGVGGSSAFFIASSKDVLE